MTEHAPLVEGLAHVGIAVRSLEEAVPRWTRSLGFRHVDTITLDSMGLKIAFLESGGTEIELLEPARPDSVIAKFLEKRGEGIHHLSFHVR
ncbi:MAG TPA: VOC family protein, partial [Candidatus Eisenbacteria bacterium]|nr:VOC family protein [Candidatus Eisenbacteria bacterium]